MGSFHIDDDRLYEKAEAMELAGYRTPWSIDNARKTGKIAAIRCGKEYRFPGWAIRRHNQGIPPNAPSERDQSSNGRGVA